MQLAAPIATDGYQRYFRFVVPVEAAPGGSQYLVDEPGAAFDQASDILAGEEACIEDLPRLAYDFLEGGDGAGLKCQFSLELAAVEQFGINLRHTVALHQCIKIRAMCGLWCHRCAG